MDGTEYNVYLTFVFKKRGKISSHVRRTEMIDGHKTNIRNDMPILKYHKSSGLFECKV